MRSRLLFAALAFVAAACDNSTDPIAPDASAPRTTLWTNPASAPMIIPVGDGSVAQGLNDVGQVVGVSAAGPVVWSAQDGATFLGSLGGSWVSPLGINNLGTVVGFSETPDGSMHPFRWKAAGGMADLGLPPGASNAYARAITKSGRIAVTAEFFDANTGDVTSRLFLWADGQ